jgi:hypothetical protein
MEKDKWGPGAMPLEKNFAAAPPQPPLKEFFKFPYIFGNDFRVYVYEVSRRAVEKKAGPGQLKK